jgi:hypothetical protein
MAKLSLKYADLVKMLGAYAVTQRTESRQFLAWFLQNYYRLEENDVDDCICDGHDDKTIDGIYVSEQLSQIHVFQAKLVKGDKSLGDSALKEFMGSMSQFKDRAAVEHLLTTAKNKDLARIIREEELAEKIEKGYVVRPVFITNAGRDHNAIAYLKTVPHLVLYDTDELQQQFVPIDKTEPIAEEVSFDVSGVPTMEYPIGTDLTMALAPIAASDLLKMRGVANGELFAYNVRQFLGKKTKVNDDLARSIQKQEEHQLFPAFHNGITVLCKKLKVGKDKITISGYAVVNGCQSLTSLNENKAKISSDLRILTKFIQTAPAGKLAAKITDHTNNQNGTTARDLQSNNLIQTRLQTEINGGGEYCYRIKRGEHLEWEKEGKQVIENELAARVLLAFDVKQPWSCHQTYRLFDDLHGPIFSRLEVNGQRIVTLYQLYQIIESKLPMFDNQLFARYRLTRFFLLYLIRQALEVDGMGKAFCLNPAPFSSTRKDKTQTLTALDKIAQVIARVVNGEIKRRDADPENPFDYKDALKSPRAVRELETAVITTFQVLADNDAAVRFEQVWKAKATKR